MDNVGPDGKLDNDRMVLALLTHRNTPDVSCKLSPAQILLRRPLRDTLPFLQKDVMCLNNPQVLLQWRESWKLKRNNRGRYPTKWDHSGTVVETKPNDQYTVKISRSGRLILRKRKFLRSYESQDLHQTASDREPDGSLPAPVSHRDVPTIRTATHVLPSPPNDK